MVGGAWPFLVGGVICLVNSDNERDSTLLNSTRIFNRVCADFLERFMSSRRMRKSNNRSVMPLDVRGRTRATLTASTSYFLVRKDRVTCMNCRRDRDRGLQLSPVNEEFPVSASHKLALITSLPFVHTARRYYRLNVLVRSLDWCWRSGQLLHRCREDDQT